MKHIFLLGYMGSGKSEIGSKLAANLGFNFIDTDKLIERQECTSISEIFKSQGENYFRSLELQLLEDFNKQEPFVISTGGGMPCDQDRVDLINKKGLSFYLCLSVNELFKRLKNDKALRPLIDKSVESAQLLDYIQTHLIQRERYYFQANYICDANKDRDSILEEIKEKIAVH